MNPVDQHFASITSSPQREILENLRDLIRTELPDLEEAIKWGKPNYLVNGKTSVCYLWSGKDYVNLGFMQGAVLDDPKGRMEGTGKMLRHIKVRSVEEIDRPYFANLLRQAKERAAKPV